MSTTDTRTAEPTAPPQPAAQQTTVQQPAVPRAPVLCRRRLRGELRRLREGAGFTGRRVAAATGWSVAKVSRLERAEGAVPEAELRTLCALYRATAEQTDTLVECAVRARARQWWHGRAYRTLPPGTGDYLGLEATADTIALYAPEYVPELLRTDEYSRAAAALPATAGCQTGDSPTEEQTRVWADAGRRRRLGLERPDGGPRLLVVLGEAVLHRVVGDRNVLRRQLRHLAELSTDPGVRLHVLPFAQPDAPAPGGPFSVLHHADGTSPVVVLDRLTGPELIEDDTATTRYRSAFRLLLSRSPDPSASRAMLTAAVSR